MSKSSLCSHRSSEQSESGQRTLRVSLSVCYWDAVNRSSGLCGEVSVEGYGFTNMPPVEFDDRIKTSDSLLRSLSTS